MIASAPTGRFAVEMEAVAEAKSLFGSLLPVTGTEPSETPAAVNFTEPVGGFAKLEVATVAVIVTLAPCAAVELLVATAVLVAPLVMVKDIGVA